MSQEADPYQHGLNTLTSLTVHTPAGRQQPVSSADICLRLSELNQHRPYETCMSSPVNILNVFHSIGLYRKPSEWSTLQSEKAVHMQARVCVWTVCWCAVFVVHEEQMALPLTRSCVFLSPSWTTAWGGPLSGQTGRWGGEGFEGTLVWRCNQADCCRAANTTPTDDVQYTSSPFLKPYRGMLPASSPAPWV